MSSLIDTSVFAGHWPFRRLKDADPPALRAKLLELGARQAWIAPLEAVFFADPMEANAPLAAEIEPYPYFVLVAAVNVSLPTWERDARACLEKLGARAFKIFPNYHGFALDEPRAAALAALAAEAGMPLCIQMRMQDERGHHPLVKVPGVKPEDVLALAAKAPNARFLVCGAYLKELKALRQAPNVWAEISFAEWELSLRQAVDSFGAEHLVFGSHAPLHYAQAAYAKLDVVPADLPLPNALQVIKNIREHHAERLLGAGKSA